ncbi:MAG: type VI secretion system ImpA family N-terminal domain-containing protein [Bryobacteraceae bacterium]
MADSNILDVEKLLTPIGGDNPAGIDIGHSVTMAEIEEMRKSILRGDNEATEPGDQAEASALMAQRRSEWREIEKQLLATFSKGKDLGAACLLVVATTNRAGWSALAPGFRLLKELQDQFWDTVYPLPDLEDEANPDYVDRLSKLERLDHESFLPLAMRQVAITDPKVGNEYSWSSHRQLEMLQESKPGKDDDVDARKTHIEEQFRLFDEAVAKTSLGFYETLFKNVDESVAELTALTDFVNERYAAVPEEDRPNFRNIQETFAQCRNLAVRLFRKKGGKFPDEMEDSGGYSEDGSGEGGGESGGSGGRGGEERDAVLLLERALMAMKAREKHNPAVFLVEEAIRWTRMPIGEWYLEATQDPNMSGFISKLMGAGSSTPSE